MKGLSMMAQRPCLIRVVRAVQLLLLAVVVFSLPSYSHAQQWSGIIAPSRAIDWSQAGVSGGIPNRTTVCTTLSSGATADQINSAIANCPSGQVVSLNAGTYNLSAGIVMKSGVTLRGAGADQTFLVFTGANSCGGYWSDVCFMGPNYEWYGGTNVQPGGSNAASWTGGYTQGTSQITLSNVGSSGLSVGQYILLDQSNDSSNNGGFLVCDNATYPCSLEGGAPGRTVSGVDRNQVQIVKITAISGSTYTISPGIYGSNWTSAKSPGAWWVNASDQIQNAGIENMSLDHTNSGGTRGITFFNAFNSWVKGVRSLNANRDHVCITQGAHIQVQDSYFYGTQNAASQSYGVESFIASDDLIANNIFQRVTAPIMMGPSLGSVFAYNFSINDYYYVSTWMEQGLWLHDAGVNYNLYEGNNGSGLMGDVFHGSSNANTGFRNYWNGWESGKSGATVPVMLFSYNRYMNLIGNVLGQPGYHNTYQTSSGNGASTSIYDLGSGNTEGSVNVASDGLVASTLMRWGNYDTVNNAVRWNASEVPSGLSQYANPVPSSQSLPSSFYYSATPSWWPTSKPWPVIGPDVTGGNISGLSGHAYTLPAQDCYSNMGGPADGSGSGLTFNASTCYGQQTTSSPPAAPTNLTVH